MLTSLDFTVAYATVFGISSILVLFLIRLILEAGTRVGNQGIRTARWLSAGLIVWALFAICYALLVSMTPFDLVPMVGIPLVTVMALSFTDPVKAVLTAIPIPSLIAAQIYRNAGALFLFLYYSSGVLSRGFAMNAGWGDVLTGMLAIPVAYAAFRKMPGYIPLVLLWSAIGIGDLILAPASALIHGGDGLDAFPLSVIPLFLGPPMGILLHFVTLRALWLQRQSEASRGASGPVLSNN